MPLFTNRVQKPDRRLLKALAGSFVCGVALIVVTMSASRARDLRSGAYPMSPSQKAHADGMPGGGTPSPAPTPTIAPPAIGLTGPQSYGTYPNQNQAILVGQSCGASVGNLPTPDPGTTPIYSWNVTGTTFESWSPTTSPSTPANLQISSYVGGFGPNYVSNPQWYWNDSSQTTETVSCSVSEIIGGQTTYFFPVSATVLVCLPTFNGFGTPGYVQINANSPSHTYEIWAGPSSPTDTTNKFGMTFHCTVTTPDIPTTSIPFGLGELELVQIVSPNDSYTSGTPAVTTSDPNDGKTGLDGTYPYDSPTVFHEDSAPVFIDGDSPGLPLSDAMTAVTFSPSFVTYLMYLPPGAAAWVPLGQLHWQVNAYPATVPEPGLGEWSYYTTPIGTNPVDWAGTVAASPTFDLTFQASNAFPMWSTIITPVAF